MSEGNKEFTFIWKIENFSMLPHETGESLESPLFVGDTWEEIEWYLRLYPRGKEDEDSLSLFLYVTDAEVKHLNANFSITLESTDSTMEITREAVHQVKGKSWGWNKFSSLTEIYAKKYLYLPQDILSLRCQIRPLDSNNEQSTANNKIECSSSFLKKTRVSRTGIQVQQRSITWSIQNISKCRESVEKSFSEVLKGSPGLKVTLNFSEITNNVCVPIEIQQTGKALLDKKQERLFVKCKITVDAVEKEYRDSKESTHLFNLGFNDVWHFPLFLKTSNLTQGKYLNQKDTLLLQCDFVFSYKDGMYTWDESFAPFASGSTKLDKTGDWCISVQNLCATGKFSDVELRAGGVTFPTNKLVLCARSSVFSAMFENDMKEKVSGVVEIDDVDPITLKRMLTFINFDDIKDDLSPEDALKLYKAADKYNIVSLKSWCRTSLMASLSVENVCDVLVLADAHHDHLLMTGVRNFICCHENEIFDSTHWKSFMDNNLKLSAEVMHKVLLNRKQILKLL